MNMEKEGISFDYFIATSQQLFFYDQFNIENIKEQFKDVQSSSAMYVGKIYGMEMTDDELICGKTKFIRNNHLKDYLLHTVKIDKEANLFNKIAIESLETTPKENDFIYFAKEYNIKDLKIGQTLFQADLLSAVNILRYLTGAKGDRFYIDIRHQKAYKDNIVTIIDNKYLAGSSKLTLKDIKINLTHKDFYDNIVSKKIWEIFDRLNPNNMEKRIMNAINWVGKSLNEDDIAIATTYIAFGFEALLKNNEYSMITTGIQAQISETVAFLIGNNAEDRIEIEETFKKLYSFRSSIVHGSSKNNDGSYLRYLTVLYQTINVLLTNDALLQINKPEDLFQLIKTNKYNSVPPLNNKVKLKGTAWVGN